MQQEIPDEFPINLEKARYQLLSSAVEDHTGLYEAIWELNSIFPDSSLGEKYRVAELIIREFTSKDYIEFHRWVFTNDYKNHVVETVTLTDIGKLLRDPTAWYPDHNRIRIVFSATEVGEQAYFSGEVPFIEP